MNFNNQLIENFFTEQDYYSQFVNKNQLIETFTSDRTLTRFDDKFQLRAILIRYLDKPGDRSNIKYQYGEFAEWNLPTDISRLFDISKFQYATPEQWDFLNDIKNWDVSNVTDMTALFRGCANFNLDISSWDVSNVTDMKHMFHSARSFNQDIGNTYNYSNCIGITWNISGFRFVVMFAHL